MSQHWATLKNGREVLYGSDKPTGGFFYIEFFTDEEQLKQGTDVSCEEASLTLTDFLVNISRNTGFIPSMSEARELALEWYKSPEPTIYQHNVSQMFGKDLNKMLKAVEQDLHHFSF